MNEIELRELVVWIAVHVMGWKLREDTGNLRFGEFRVSGNDIIYNQKGDARHRFNPITNPADTLKVLEKCAKKCPVVIWFDLETWLIADNSKDDGEDNETSAETLPPAICEFAKLLYSEKGSGSTSC